MKSTLYNKKNLLSIVEIWKFFLFDKFVGKQKLLGIFTYKVQIFSLLSILYRVYFYSYGWVIPYVFIFDYFSSFYFLNHMFFFSLFLCYFFLFILFCLWRTSWLIMNKLVDNFKIYVKPGVVSVLAFAFIWASFFLFVMFF